MVHKSNSDNQDYSLEDSLKQVEDGEIVGPFLSVDDFMDNLLKEIQNANHVN